ncbi:MAG: fimbria/pilus periplasmic chaperone [Oceanicaulis sp.]
MRFDLTPSGQGARDTLTIENPQNRELTVEIFAVSIDVAEDGEETRTPADEDFLIFPPQAIIQPGATQNVQVRYVGSPDIETSRAYRLIVRQVPLDMTGQTNIALGVALSFATLVNIVPDGAEPAPRVAALEPAGPDAWRVFVENDGARYVRLSEYDFEFSEPGGANYRLAASDLHDAVGQQTTFVPPRTRLRLDVPVGVRFADTPALRLAPVD